MSILSATSGLLAKQSGKKVRPVAIALNDGLFLCRLGGPPNRKALSKSRDEVT